MPARLNFVTASPDTYKAMSALQQHVSNSGLEPGLLHLVSLLVSRMNGCAYCIDMHGKDLRAAGETQLRIDLISVWHEVDVYSEREHAAFAWAASVTNVGETHVPEEVFALARKQFSEEELVKLTLAVIAINGWNRLCIAFRNEPGRYQAQAGKASSAA